MKRILILFILLCSVNIYGQVPGTDPIVNSVTNITLASAPSNPVIYQRYLSDVDKNWYIWNGSTWELANYIKQSNLNDISGNNSKVGLIAGGTTGQILSKVDGTSYNVEWINPPAGGGTGGIGSANQSIPGSTVRNINIGTTSSLNIRNNVGNLIATFEDGGITTNVPVEYIGSVSFAGQLVPRSYVDAAISAVSGTTGVPLDGSTAMTAELRTPGIYSTGDALVFYNSQGQRILRLIDFPTAWQPDATTSFFQFGRSSALFTANNGFKLDQVGFFTDGFTIANNSFQDLPEPTAMLDVRGDVKATSFEGDGSALTNIGTSALASDAVVTDKIDNRAVTLSKMANLAPKSVIGNMDSALGVPLAIPVANLTPDLADFTTSQKGVVPASGGGTTNFLRADGTWAAPSTGGSGANNDSFTGTELTDGYNFTAADFVSGRKQFWYDGATDIEITVPSDVAAFGQKVIIWQYGNGKIQVNVDSSLNGISFQTVDILNPITLTKAFDTFGYRPIGNWEAYTPVNALYTGANPADPNNETTDVSMIIFPGTGTASSSTVRSTAGTRSIRVNSTSIQDIEIPLQNISLGDTVTFSIDVYAEEINGAAFVWLKVGSGWNGPDVDGTTYEQVTVTSSAGGQWQTITLTAVASQNNPSAYISIGNAETLDFDNIIYTVG